MQAKSSWKSRINFYYSSLTITFLMWTAPVQTREIRIQDLSIITLNNLSPAIQIDWGESLTIFDRQRIIDFPKALQAATNDPAEEEKNPEPRHYIKRIYSLKKLPIDEESMIGEYICRKTVLGKPISFTYDWFSCSIYKEKNVLIFHKRHGSQKSIGIIFRKTDYEMVYAGSRYSTEKYSYSHNEPKIGDSCNEYRNNVAVINKVSEKYYIMGFPGVLCAPGFEVIEVKNRSVKIIAK